MNRVEPAHVPGCFKMFNTTGVNRDEPGRMSNTGVNRPIPGRYRPIPGTSVAQPGLYRDEPGRMSNTGVNRGDAGAIPAHSGNVRGSTGSLP